MRKYLAQAGVIGAAYAAALILAACFPKDSIQTPARPLPPPVIQPLNLSGLCLEVRPIDQTALAKALAPVPPDSPIISAMADYKRMRDEARACKAKAAP